jgi:hypothetical protein
VTISTRGSLSILDFRLTQLAYWTGILATFLVLPWTNFDPISVPKLMVITIGAFGSLFLILFNRTYFFKRISTMQKFVLILFLIALFVPMAFTDSEFQQQFWGVFGRNTGFLAYFSLLIILFAVASIQKTELYERILWVFTLSSIPMTVYCLIQYFKLDPINWSEKFVFGTLGNVNFLSAYLGMTSIACVGYCLNRRLDLARRAGLGTLAVIDIFLIISTKSIQGPVIFAIGLAFIPLLLMLTKKHRLSKYLFPYLLVGIFGASLLVLSLFNKGPLAKIIFQPSIIFRADYMHAGYAMYLKFPFTGVGMDSYGDWYREMRGELSTTRTGPGRVSNTAHNIFLDVASNGGTLLAIGYLLILFLVIKSIVQLVRRSEMFNPAILTITSVWIAYQVQALVSINQLGVGVWGWILSGALLGLEKSTSSSGEGDKSTNSKTHKNKNSHKGQLLPAGQSLVLFLGLILGFLLSIPPVVADAAYRRASSQGKFEPMYQSTHRLGSTAQHKELLLDWTVRNGLASETRLVTDELIKKYPRSFYGWRILSVSTASTAEERAAAIAKARLLDPFNPELR